MRPISLIAWLWMFCCALPGISQATDYTFNNAVVGNSSTVCSFAQDEQGLMWLGTENGLYSFDGYDSYARFAPKTAENTRIHALHLHKGILFLGTDSGLLLFDIRRNAYLEAPADVPKDIRAIAEDNGRIYLGGSMGLYACHPENGRVSSVALSVEGIYALLPTPRGLLVGTLSGLYLVGGGRSRLLAIGTGSQPLVNALLKAPSGEDVYVGTEGALFRYDWKTFSPVSPLNGQSVKSLAAKEGKLYAGTDNGLYVCDAGNAQSVLRLTHDSRQFGSVANNIVWALFADRQKNLWVGTDHGLSQLPARKFCRFVPLSSITGSGDGNCLHAILREPDGTTWLGGTSGLIRCRLSATTGPISATDVAWFRQNDSRHPLSHNRVRKIYRDREGLIVVCTDHGINVYDRRSGQFRNYVVHDQTGRYSTAWAYDIVEDLNGRYWIAAYMGGIFVISKKRLLSSGGSAIADRHFSRELQGIHVGQLAFDGKSLVRARFYGQGVDQIDTRTFRVSRVLGDTATVRLLLSDGAGNTWAGLDGEVRQLGASRQADRVFPIGGSGHRQISAMTEAGGTLWAVSGDVCNVFRPDGRSSSFTFGGFLPFAAWHDASDRLVWFGGNDGLMLVAADALGRDGGKRKLLLSGMLVNGKPFSPAGEGISYLRELTLASNQNNLLFRLTDLPYTGGAPKRYAYRLEGIDHAWQHLAGPRPEMSYNGLPHGTYRLRVCVVDGRGTAGEEAYALKLRILPPWYLTVWAKLVYFSLFVGFCLWGMNFYLMKKQLLAERRAKEQVMEQSEARAAFFDHLSQDIKVPLGEVMAQAYALLPDESDSRRHGCLDNIRKKSTAINQLIHETLDVSGISRPPAQNKTGTHLVNLSDFCRRMAGDLRPVAEKRKIALVFKTDMPVLPCRFDLAHFQPLMYALMRRAIDGTPEGGEVTLRVCEKEGTALAGIRVEVPGMFIPQGELPFVFYRYGRPKPGMAGQTGHLNELAALKDFVEGLQGQACVEADEASGTVFFITLPCDRETAAERSSLPLRSEPKAVGEARTETPDDKLLAEITASIERHLSDGEFNVTRLQENVGIGSKLLYRRVKQLTGKTPVEFIRHIRMQRAALLLREGKFSVSEVMYMVGYSNSGYFSKRFAEAYGIAPAAYAKQAASAS